MRGRKGEETERRGDGVTRRLQDKDMGGDKDLRMNNNPSAHPEPFDSIRPEPVLRQTQHDRSEPFALRLSKHRLRTNGESKGSPRTVVAICTCSSYLCAAPKEIH